MDDVSRLTADESLRISALMRFGAMDSAGEPDFDRLAGLAARLFDARYATIALIDERRAWFKARFGHNVAEMARDEVLSSLLLEHDTPLIIGDVALDPQYRRFRSVSDPEPMRFYAGAALITAEGARIGAIAVMDTSPRAQLPPHAATQLTELAAIAVTLLERAWEQRQQREQAMELRLINDILTRATGSNSLAEAIGTSVEILRAALGASICSILELGPHDGLIHLLAIHAAPEIAAQDLARLVATLPAPRSALRIGDHFDVDLDSLVFDLTPPALPEEGRFVVGNLLHDLGMHSSIHVALHVGGHRFAIDLNFGERADLEEVRQRVIRLQRAIRPMLQRKLAEESLSLLSAALDVTSDAVMITDAESIDPPGPRIVYVNQSFTRMTGWKAEDAVGQTPRIMQSALTDRRELDRIRAALQQWQPVRAELLNRRRDGTPFWTELDIVPLADAAGGFTHWVAVQRDATERRAREEAARQTAATMKRLTDELLTANRIARMGPWHWDRTRKSLTWSPEVCRIFDVDADRINVSLSKFMEIVHPEDRERVRARIGAPIDASNRFDIDFRILARDGSTRHCRCEGDVDLDADGQPIGASGFCQDVSERKQAEAMLIHTEKLNSIGQLTGGIAHDFNNLLTVIAINLEIAGAMLGPGHPVTEVLDPARKAAASGAGLTESLLAYARRQPLSPTPSDLNAALVDLHRLATRSLGDRHDLRLDLQTDLPLCRIDRVKFENAVLNLVLNSRDAMPAGGAITVSTRLLTITPREARRIGELEPGPHVLVSVTDTGTGIPASIQQHVFDPFFTTKPVGKGTGLGLSMVVGFVRQSGGQVTLDSREAEGTTISIYLPVAE